MAKQTKNLMQLEKVKMPWYVYLQVIPVLILMVVVESYVYVARFVRELFCKHDWVGNLQIPRNESSIIYGKHALYCYKCDKSKWYRMIEGDTKELEDRTEAWLISVGRKAYWK